MKNIIDETLTVIWDELKKEFVPFPRNNADWQKISSDFESIGGLPHQIGALDGKHVRIRQPPHTGTLYYNYKKFFSIVLMALVDANSNFIYVDVGAPGSNNDAIVFHHTNLFKKLEEETLNIPNPEPIEDNGIPIPYFIIGDGGFGLKKYLIKPYSST